MSGGYDDGIDNLRRYVALAADTLERIQATTPTIESQGNALDDLENRVDDQLSSLDSEADGFVSDLDSAEADAVEDVGRVTSLAQDAADDRLPDAQQDVEEAGSRIEQSMNAAGQELTSDDQALTSEGFEALGTALDAAQAAYETTETQNESAFTALKDGLDGFEGELETAYTDSGKQLEDARTDCGDETSVLTSETSTQVQAMDAAGSEFEGAVSQMETEAGTAYDGVGDQVETEAQELTDGVRQALEDEAQHLATELTDSVEQASTLVSSDSAGPHLEELGTLREAVFRAESAGADLEPLVADLVRCQQVCETINRRNALQ